MKHLLISSIAASVMLSACSTVPVQSPVPTSPLPAEFRGLPGSRGVELSDQWWASFNDALLAELVERALASNHDIAAALQRVKAARAGTDIQGSRLWPAVGLQATTLRSSSGLPDVVKQGQPDTKALRLGLDLSWEVDLAGGVRAARDAAAEDARRAQAAAVGAQLLVASEVARQYFLWRGATDQLRIVSALANAQSDTAELVQGRQREGQASAFDLDRARAEAAALQTQIPPLRTLIGASQNRLAVLMGVNPSATPPDSAQPFIWPVVRLIAPGQPSQLLQRRPDLVAAEARFFAETMRSQEARAQWWPQTVPKCCTRSSGLAAQCIGPDTGAVWQRCCSACGATVQCGPY